MDILLHGSSMKMILQDTPVSSLFITIPADLDYLDGVQIPQ